jgi:hypothetical protein
MVVCAEKSTRMIKKGSRTQPKPAMSRANHTHTGQKTPIGEQGYLWRTSNPWDRRSRVYGPGRAYPVGSSKACT